MGRGPRIDSPTVIKSTERIGEALRLRRAGWTYEEIAQASGYKTASAAYNAVSKAMVASRKDLAESAADLVQLEVERLEFLWRQVVEKIEGPGKCDAGTIKAGVDVLSRKSRLLGLDRPIQHDHMVQFSMTENEANNSSDVRLAVVLLQKCFMVHGENPLEIARQALQAMGDMGAPLLAQDNVIDAEVVEDGD